MHSLGDRREDIGGPHAQFPKRPFRGSARSVDVIGLDGIGAKLRSDGDALPPLRVTREAGV